MQHRGLRHAARHVVERGDADTRVGERLAVRPYHSPHERDGVCLREQARRRAQRAEHRGAYHHSAQGSHAFTAPAHPRTSALGERHDDTSEELAALVPLLALLAADPPATVVAEEKEAVRASTLDDDRFRRETAERRAL